MNGNEFIRKVRKLARRNGLAFDVVAARGKGSHKTLWLGDRRTTVKHGEIGKGLLSTMCGQLNIKPDDL